MFTVCNILMGSYMKSYGWCLIKKKKKYIGAFLEFKKIDI